MSLIYANYDFAHGYLNAIGSKEPAMQKDIIIVEIGRLLFDDKTNLIKVMRKNGIDVNYSTPDLRIGNLLGKALESNNNELSKDIATLITNNRLEQSSIDQYFSADSKLGSYASQILKDEKTQTAITDSVSNLITNIFSKKKKAPTTTDTTPKTDSAATKLLMEQLRLNEIRNKTLLEQQKKAANTTKIALISIGSLVALTGIIILIVKLSRPKKMEYGGEVELEVASGVATV
jgi:hypothetical protein